MRFSANISTLWSDVPSLLDRYLLALRSTYKFEAIECQSPYQHSLRDWQQTFESCLESSTSHFPCWDLINTPATFNLFEQIPEQAQYESKVLQPAIEYATKLNVRKVHLMMADTQQPEDVDKIKRLLRFASERLRAHNITCLIEPLAIRPRYYLRCYHQACHLIEELQQPNLKVMLDSFHLQKLNGNITELIQKLRPHIGHVQVSQVPSRDSPANEGEINFDYFFRLIASLYPDFIGLEYNAGSKEDFTWLNKYSSW